MIKEIRKMKWELYQYKYKKLFLWGLKNGYIRPYDDKLIKKLRTVYSGGIPASIILLSINMSKGKCYDRAFLMSKAFLDEEDDVKLIYADVDGIKLNPLYIDDEDPNYADHCFVERTTKDGKKLIYDTSIGYVYDKRIYWMIENPKIRKINDKNSILEFAKSEEKENIERDKYSAPLIIPLIEMLYNESSEIYAQKNIELLQREIEHYKKLIDYDSICKEIDEGVKKMIFQNNKNK